jgi:hypothetical protein
MINLLYKSINNNFLSEQTTVKISTRSDKLSLTIGKVGQVPVVDKQTIIYVFQS